MEVPETLQYSEEHEWVRSPTASRPSASPTTRRSSSATSSSSSCPRSATVLAKAATLGVVESVKAVCDVYAPVGGTVVEVNDELTATPRSMNEDPYGDGWMVKVSSATRPSSTTDDGGAVPRVRRAGEGVGRAAMRFTLTPPADVAAMLAAIGVAERRGALRARARGAPRHGGARALPAGLDEREMRTELAALAARNRTDSVAFLGAGAYPHFIPAAVEQLAGRAEFATAYTPYQPEVSQGTLQASFEFQTPIAALLGIEVANASMYDGATATAEAVLMAQRLRPGRPLVLVARALHPHYRQTIATYLAGVEDVELVEVPYGARRHDRRCPRPTSCDARRASCSAIRTSSAWSRTSRVRRTSSHAEDCLLVSATAEALALGAPASARRRRRRHRGRRRAEPRARARVRRSRPRPLREPRALRAQHAGAAGRRDRRRRTAGAATC